MASDSGGRMGKARGNAEPRPWHSQAALAMEAPEQPRRRLLDAPPLRESEPRRRRHLLGAVAAAASRRRPPGAARGVLAVVARRRHLRHRGPLGAARGTIVAAVRRRRRLLAQLGALVDGEGQAQGVRRGVAGQPEDDLAEIKSEGSSGPETLITACDSNDLLSSSTVGGKLREVSDASLLHRSLTVHDSVKDARLLLLQVLGGYGIRATFLDARVQLIPSEETSHSETLIMACDSTALLFSSTLEIFRKKAMRKLHNLSDVRLLHLPHRVDDPLEDERLLLQVQGGHRIITTLLDNRRFQLTQVGGMNSTDILVMGNVDVKEADPEQNAAICTCLGVSSRTQGPMIVWFLLKNSGSIFQGESIHDLILIPKCVPLPEIFCSPLEEMEESVSDHQYPISPPTVNITACSLHHNESQQADAWSQGNVQSKQGNKYTRSDTEIVPIFVRQISGKVLVMTVNLNEPSEHLFCLYEEKTKMKLSYQYFSFKRKTIEPDCTLLSYGIGRNSTVDVCGRLLGGNSRTQALQEFVSDNKEGFSSEVTLPDRKVSLDMTPIGCLFLITLLKCFTKAWSNSWSWNGIFQMADFIVVNSHVQVTKVANVRLNISSLQADAKWLSQYIRRIFCKDRQHLISKYPPFLENLIHFLYSLKSPVLYDSDKIFIEAHLSCMESFDRGMLLVEIRKKFKSLNKTLQKIWARAISRTEHRGDYPSIDNLSKIVLFDDIIEHAKNDQKEYKEKRMTSIFRLARDNFVHGPSKRFDKSVEPWKENFKNDDGIELMVPAHMQDLIAKIIYSLITSKGVDITAELLAASVRCACNVCCPSNYGSQDGGQCSKAGKQPALPPQGAQEKSQVTRLQSDPAERVLLLQPLIPKPLPGGLKPKSPSANVMDKKDSKDVGRSSKAVGESALATQEAPGRPTFAQLFKNAAPPGALKPISPSANVMDKKDSKDVGGSSKALGQSALATQEAPGRPTFAQLFKNAAPPSIPKPPPPSKDNQLTLVPKPPPPSEDDQFTLVVGKKGKKKWPRG